MEEGEQKVESQVQPGTRAAGSGLSVGPGAPIPCVRAGSPRRPQRLPPGSAPARSGRLTRPRPLLVFLFLVPGRASRSEEPGEAVPGGAASPPAAGHRHGEAVGPGPSAGSAQGGVLRPESGPGGTDSARAAGVAQSIPGERGAGTTSYRRGCSYCCAAAPPPAPVAPPQGGARSRGPALAAVRGAGWVAARGSEPGKRHTRPG